MALKILIIGPSGYIGTFLTLSLKEKYNLSCIVRKNSKIELTNYINYYFHEELTDDQVFIKILSRYDILINCYGYAHSTVKTKKNLSDLIKSNIYFCKRLFKLSSMSKIKKVIHLSSIKAMGEFGNFHIGTIPKPRSFYGRSKLISEKILIKNFRNQESEKKFHIIRLPLVFGKNKPRGYLKIINYYLKLKLPFPIFKYSNYRSYVSENDLTRLISSIIEDKDRASGIILYQSFKLNFKDLVDEISKINNNNPSYFFIPNFLVDLVLKSFFKNLYIKIFSENIIKSNYNLN